MISLSISSNQDSAAIQTGVPSIPAISRRRSTLERCARDSRVRIVATILSTMVLVTLFAPLLGMKDPSATDLSATLSSPSSTHWLGTDQIGRDTFARVVYGSRVSLTVGIVAVAIALAIGVPLGLLSGYGGGLVDSLVMRTVDIVSSVPPIMLVIAIVTVLGTGITNAMIAIGVVTAPSYARLVRSEALVARELDFALSARSMGASPFRIVYAHIFPATIPSLIVQSSLGMGFAILTEASLSYLGLGIQPPQPSWGGMIRAGYGFLQTNPWMVIAPGAATFVAVLSFNTLGDALRDLLDPRLRNRGAN